MQKWSIIIPLLLLGACTTIEDFQAMSPEERAQEVCSATNASRQRSASLANINNQIMEKEQILATGYRVYEDCQVLPVVVPARLADCSGKSGSDLESCQQKDQPARTEYRRVCRDIPIPIDYQYESSILRDLRMSREDQLEIHDQQTYDCISKARSLPATDAYLLYKSNAEP
jgi:hypothetical protein